MATGLKTKRRRATVGGSKPPSKGPAVAPREPKPVTKRTYTGKLARRLRELRTAKGISVTDLAKSVGVTPVAIYKWESAENQIDADKYPALAKALKVSVAEFFPEF